jgi:acetyl esterase
MFNIGYADPGSGHLAPYNEDYLPEDIMDKGNKIRVLERISAEMQQILRFQQENPPPLPDGNDYPALRRAYNEERRYWNAGGQKYRPKTLMSPRAMALFARAFTLRQNQRVRPRFFIFTVGALCWEISIRTIASCDCWRITQCTVVGIDYTLSPEARFPQAIEEAVAVCQFYAQQADT